MGYLFENMEKMDIQLECRLRKEAEDRANASEKRLQEALKEAESRVNTSEKQVKILQEKNIETYISASRRYTDDRASVSLGLQENFGLTETEAERKMELYWKLLHE